ncbi:MAG: FHA domain-containing protein [Gammaproteobacteria bacterium]|nr:FHA domain-containing protein [Gammaproteobacteria bacterium]
MPKTQENPEAIPAYLEFFGMKRPPFAKLSVPSQLFHSDQYSVLADHLASATEQSDFLLVLCGAEGSGKTTLLNRHIVNLDEDVSYATFDETCANGTQFYCGLLRQLGFHDISGKLNELRNIAREFLIHRGTAGDHVLLIIDNAHLVCASVLEQLRWIAGTKVKDRRVLSVVLAGNSDLVRIMGSPAMQNLRFQRHVDFNIRVYSEQETEDYVRHRLRLSGGADAAKFAHEAHPAIYRFTGGIPVSINRLCNAVLTEACSLATRVVTGDLVRSVAETHKILPHVVPLQGMGRRKTDSSVSLVIPVQQPEERIIARDPPPRPAFESPAPGSAVADVDLKELLNQVSQLSGQLAVQTQKTETLSNTVLDDTAEIRRLEDALSETRKALQESESAADELTAKADAEIEELERETSELQESAKQLAADLKIANRQAARIDALEKSLQESQDECETLRSDAADSRKELRAAKKATTAAAKAEAKIEKLEREKSELQDECKSLRSGTADSRKEMRAAKKATTAAAKAEAKIEKLERENSELQVSIKGLTADLKIANKQAARIDALEKSLQESQDECASLRSSADTLTTLEESVSERDARIVELKAELDSYVKANTKNQPELPDKQAQSPRAQPMPDTSIEQTARAIATIEVLRNGKIDQVMNIAEGPSRIMIGRGDDCELCLESKFVSRHHALIFCNAEGVYIEDLNSSNGTVVNSRKESRCVLHANDNVMIGDFQLRPRSAVKNDPV